MITREEAWEVAMDAAMAQRQVKVTCRTDGKSFEGVLSHVDYDYVVIGGLGFPLTEISLEVLP